MWLLDTDPTSDILAAIEQFLRASGMSAKAFGDSAAGDPAPGLRDAEGSRTAPRHARPHPRVHQRRDGIMKPASGPPDTAPCLPNAATARLPGGGLSMRDSPSPGFFSDFVPIHEAVARVVGRVMRRERAEPEIGG